MDTLEEFEKKSQKESGKSGGPDLRPGPGGDEPGGERSASTDLSATADLQDISEGADRDIAQTTKVWTGDSIVAKTNDPPNAAKSGGGGTGETSPGGAGAGQGQEGTPVSATPEPASGSGDPDRVRGQFRPGSLSPSEEEALFDALEARASVEGPFEQFGPEVRPYVTEATHTLESEPTDPRMKSWVESYLRHLAG
jgi:hypothetical protein